MNWKKIANHIPHAVRTKAKVVYELVWVDEFKHPEVVGETRFDTKQIVVKNGLSPKEEVLTTAHEFFHAVSDSYDIGLTEEQVKKLEQATPYLMEFFRTIEGRK